MPHRLPTTSNLTVWSHVLTDAIRYALQYGTTEVYSIMITDMFPQTQR